MNINNDLTNNNQNHQFTEVVDIICAVTNCTNYQITKR